MAGKKSKKITAPPPPQPPPPPADIAVGDSDDLMSDLLAELEARESSAETRLETSKVLEQVSMVQVQQAAGKKDSRARFKAREARKAVALAEKYAPSDAAADARLQDGIKREAQVMQDVCKEYDLELHEINPDGHCLFSAVADQLLLLGLLPTTSANYSTIRHAAAQFIRTHEDDFLPFLPSVDGEDGSGATSSGLMTHEQFASYCATIQDTGAWGGEPEIQALARAYSIPIFVVQAEQPHIVSHLPSPSDTALFGDPSVVRISYHRRMYGLGEHYNSLRPRSERVQNQETPAK